MKALWHWSFIIPALLLASCGDEAKPVADHGDSVAVRTTADSVLIMRDSLPSGTNGIVSQFGGDTTVACYYYDKGEEHNRMYIMRTGNDVMGDLQLNWDKADATKGSFFGVFSGDTIWATFDHVSESSKVREEVVFLLVNDQMLLGQGELNDDPAVRGFKNRKKIKFDETKAMAKGDCN